MLVCRPSTARRGPDSSFGVAVFHVQSLGHAVVAAGRRSLSDDLFTVTPGTAASELSVDLVASLDEARGDWRKLGEHGENVFGTWEWVSTWWRHFGRNRPLVVGVCRVVGAGEAKAILPLYVAAQRPARVLRLLGHGPTDQLGPVCDADDRGAAAKALRVLLDDAQLAWDALIADELPADIDWAALLEARLLARTASPTARLEGCTYAEWLASRSANLRSALRRGERGLEAIGKVRYRVTSDPDRVDHDLGVLLKLHEARWRGSGGSRSFAGREAFHRDIAQQAFARGWLRLRFLEVDARPVAALYNLRFAGNESFYQSGRDPCFDRFSPGLLLHAHAIRDAIESGCREYRFLRGGEPYKHRFADHDVGLQSVGVARGASGRVAVRMLKLLPGLPRWAVRRIPAPFAWGTGGSPIWGRP